jgi:endonuclease/exonuclease/phosphatase family metal-dependent hydrolase
MHKPRLAEVGVLALRWWLRAAAIGAVALTTACRTGRDYPSALGPRYAGAPPASIAELDSRPAALRIVSFNIAFAREIDGAIALLTSDSALRGADVILLQEMDAVGTQRIAAALHMGYVYYPAIFHNGTGRDFGNAILSRWPIVDDAKLVLPHPSRYARTHRIATAATLLVGTETIRVYSTHLGTVADIGSGQRRDQLRTILVDAERHPRVVIGGDLNDSGVGVLARQAGYEWPTQHGRSTTRFGRLDHVFLRGLSSPDSAAAGTVADSHGVSDHRPVWALAILP